MSITFDTERWSNRWHARDIDEIQKRSGSPRVVSLGDLPFFKSKRDIEGEAYFRLFTGAEDSGKRKPKQTDTSSGSCGLKPDND
jgi:hypothetical protein